LQNHIGAFEMCTDPNENRGPPNWRDSISWRCQ
jgi:hypothetical protein